MVSYKARPKTIAFFFILLTCGNVVCVSAKAAVKANQKEGEKEDLPAWMKVLHLKSIYDRAIRYGESFGVEYEKYDQYKGWTTQEKTDDVIKRMCFRNAITGAGFGFFGPAGMLGSVPGSLSLQVSLVAAVATIKGYDVDENIVRLMIAGVLGGDYVTESLKASLKAAGVSSAKQLFKKSSGKVVQKVIDTAAVAAAQKVVQTLGLHHSKSALSKVFGIVPIVGSVTSFVVDGGMCLVVAQTLDWALLDINKW